VPLCRRRRRLSLASGRRRRRQGLVAEAVKVVGQDGADLGRFKNVLMHEYDWSDHSVASYDIYGPKHGADLGHFNLFLYMNIPISMNTIMLIIVL
jgi:hypothetical protein